MKLINTKQTAFSRRLDREIEELLNEIRREARKQCLQRKAKREENNKTVGEE